LRSLAKSNRPIDRALLKHGFSNFSLEILEYCDIKVLLEREQYYLNRLKPVYNVVEKAGSTIGYKHTEETLKKMREFILSDEDLTKKRLSTKNASAARSISVLVRNIKTKEVNKYKSMTETAKAIGVTKGAVSQALKGNKIINKLFYVEIIK
jgi:O6-methylguanine-DNA--protein-cysteine methyltransferase